MEDLIDSCPFSPQEPEQYRVIIITEMAAYWVLTGDWEQCQVYRKTVKEKISENPPFLALKLVVQEDDLTTLRKSVDLRPDDVRSIVVEPIPDENGDDPVTETPPPKRFTLINPFTEDYG